MREVLRRADLRASSFTIEIAVYFNDDKEPTIKKIRAHIDAVSDGYQVYLYVEDGPEAKYMGEVFPTYAAAIPTLAQVFLDMLAMAPADQASILHCLEIKEASK